MLLEKQDYIRMKQKEEIAENKELIKAQEDGIELRDDVIRKQAIEIEKKHDQISLKHGCLRKRSISQIVVFPFTKSYIMLPS